MKAALIALGALTAAAPVFTDTPVSAAMVIHDDHKAELDIVQPWARETTKSAMSGAVYLSLTYKSDHGDKLTGASTPAAKMTQIHNTITQDGIAMMREMDPISLEKGSVVTFEPGGKHIMLMGLNGQLKKGETFPVTLHFEESSDVTITVTVTPVTGPE